MNINFISGGMSMRLAAGVFEASRNLVLHLNKEEFGVRVFGIADPLHAAGGEWGNVKPQTFTAMRPAKLGYSSRYLQVLLSSPADVAHLQGLWMYQSEMAYKWHRRFGKPYMTTVHGMLDPWAIEHSQFKKRLALLLYERKALNSCACFHATTEKEYEQVRSFRLANPVAIIPNGIPIPDLSRAYVKPPWSGLVDERKKVLLYFGRVHPKKGLANLVKAMALLQQQNPVAFEDWCVVIAGAEKNEHASELSRLIAANHLEKKIYLLGQYYQEEKLSCYYHCDAFILPSFSEGMPLAALDAWAFGKYSLLTKECNLPEGFDEGVAGKIEPDPDSIAKAIQELFAMPDVDRKAAGMKARQLAIKSFSWGEAARKTGDVYRWLAGRSSAPPFVRFT
jgi:poly(glycerol-phosphate) alpha-glucosyltransferase